jgi:hypothetical protein
MYIQDKKHEKITFSMLKYIHFLIVDIYTKSSSIIERYFQGEEDEEDAMNAVPVVAQNGQFAFGTTTQHMFNFPGQH